MTADAEARFAAAWREAGAPKRLLLAVSGGGDSIAMMRLAAPLARGGVRIRVATVDHGLRPASAADADFVMHEAAALGLEAAILRWNGAKPDAGVQAAARAARYRLLASEAERSKAEAILTAHTAEDQAETLLMRIAHSTGVRGLSGMAGEVFIADGAGPPQRLLRLLLGERRKALRDYLAALGARFIDDPSNDDLRFERVRIRRLVETTPDRERVVADVLRLSARAVALQEITDRVEALEFGNAGGAFLADGGVWLRGRVGPPLAARLTHVAGGGDHAPGADAAGAALAAAFAGRRATLSGAVIEASKGGLLFRREPAAVLGRAGETGMAPIRLPPGGRSLWDRRFIVENIFGTPAEVRPLGPAARALSGPLLPALDAAPGLFLDGALAAFPGDEGDGNSAIRALASERFARRVIRF